MGDIAEMMLDGTLCQCCGGYLGADGDYPQSCNDCKKDEMLTVKAKHSSLPKMKKIECPKCKKWFGNLQQHDYYKHGAGMLKLKG